MLEYILFVLIKTLELLGVQIVSEHLVKILHVRSGIRTHAWRTRL